MKSDGLAKIMASEELTKAEKTYIFDIEWRHGGSFTTALFEAIAKADATNRARLSLGFAEEVCAYRAWTEGDLYERASRIAGGNVDYIERDEAAK